MKKRILVISLIALAVLLCTAAAGYAVISHLFNGLLTSPESEISVQAPDAQRKLVIKEWSTFGATVADIYYFEEGVSLFRTEIGSTMADDMCLPFKDGDYSVEWGENEVTVNYLSGREGQTDDPATWESDTFELPDHRYQRWVLAGMIALALCIFAIPIVIIILKLRRHRRASL